MTCSTNMCESFVDVSQQHLLSVLCLLAFELKYLDHVLNHFTKDTIVERPVKHCKV